MGMINEFKEFAIKGNMVDMAVGIIMGGAFGKIVSSLVADVIMPVVGALSGGVDFSQKFLWLGEGDKPATLEAAKEAGGAYVGWGTFVTHAIDFLFIAMAIFVMVKVINNLKKKAEEAPSDPPKQEVLLEEIRDLLSKR